MWHVSLFQMDHIYNGFLLQSSLIKIKKSSAVRGQQYKRLQALNISEDVFHNYYRC